VPRGKQTSYAYFNNDSHRHVVKTQVCCAGWPCKKAVMLSMPSQVPTDRKSRDAFFGFMTIAMVKTYRHEPQRSPSTRIGAPLFN
jgi:hypothetical protein